MTELYNVKKWIDAYDRLFNKISPVSPFYTELVTMGQTHILCMKEANKLYNTSIMELKVAIQLERDYVAQREMLFAVHLN